MLACEVRKTSPENRSMAQAETAATGGSSIYNAAGKKDRPPTAKSKRPPYAKIHAKPLPLEIFPLPAFVPHNPLSLVRILAALLGEFISRPKSHPSQQYVGYFSPETRSVHVTDPKHARALWEMGFFGKGTLSRSEPTWLDREQARLEAGAGGTSEEHTLQRREERRLFKLERARAEREAVEEQLRKEGKLGVVLRGSTSTVDVETTEPHRQAGSPDVKSVEGHPTTKSSSPTSAVNLAGHRDVPSMGLTQAYLAPLEATLIEDKALVVDQEHMQLSICEAFFLSYGLGVLRITSPPAAPHTLEDTESNAGLLELFARHSAFPPCQASSLRPDNTFLLSYVVYHHYRSLGWVLRSGVKFAADWLLYNRGPVFSHADFAVVVVPEYPAAWEEHWSGEQRSAKEKQSKWWELTCVNRVQNQVFKTLVLCYVEIPLSVDWTGGDVGQILRSYKVRDVAVRRWLANRSRD